MKTANTNTTYYFLIFLFIILAGTQACTFVSKQNITITPTLSIEEMVVKTMTALSLQLTQTPDIPSQADVEENSYSVEITQEVLQETPTTEVLSIDQPLPSEHYIYNITGHRQYFPIGCEASAVTDWAMYFGVVINEFNFQYQLPQSDNPDLGFVGSVDGPWGQVPPYAYGVHAAPIAQVLQEEYGLNAQGIKDYTLEELKAEVAADRPVIAWVIGNCVGGVPFEYTDSQGNTTIVAAYEHVIIVTGYSEENIRYMNNGKFYEIPNEYFLNSWGVLGNMVVYLEQN